MLSGASKILKDGFIMRRVCDTVKQIVEGQIRTNGPKSVLVLRIFTLPHKMITFCVSGPCSSLGGPDILCHILI